MGTEREREKIQHINPRREDKESCDSKETSFNCFHVAWSSVGKGQLHQVQAASPDKVLCIKWNNTGKLDIEYLLIQF